MKDYGFIRVAAAVPAVRVADVKANTEDICRMTEEAENGGASVVLFPELSVTGYTCGDLFGQQLLIDEAEAGVRKILEYTRGKAVTVVVGAPVRFRGRLYNCAIVLRNGNIKGIVPKIWLPNYNEFYEARWFSSGRDFLSPYVQPTGRYLVNGKDTVREGWCAEIGYAGFRCNISPNLIFEIGKTSFGIEICEDMWAPVPPSSYLALAGARIILNPSASNDLLSKHEYRRTLVSQQSARNVCGYVYCSSGFGESTQDLVFGGAAMIYENGTRLAENERFRIEPSLTFADIDTERLDTSRQKMSSFAAITPDGTPATAYDRLYSRVSLGRGPDTDFREKLFRSVDPQPFVPAGNPAETDARCREIMSIQVTGLASRLRHIGCKTAVLGISGGLDSTLALIVTVLAFDRLGWDRKRIVAITMPGYGTTDRTYGNAVELMESLGVASCEIPIAGACDRHFADIGHDKDIHDTTYENSQARERTQILMDVANQTGGIVVGTGDLSELALGWATYNGDHMSMYGVNAGIPKTLVKYIVKWAAENHFDGTDGSVADVGNTEVSPSGTGSADIAAAPRSTGEILADIIDTPISPELLPADGQGRISQKTEDLVGPYELHDFFLYHFFRSGYAPEKILFLAEKAFAGKYDSDTIRKWLKTFVRRFFSQQFKRSCLPDGPKVGSVSLSPRGDWRMPSDARPDLFLSGLES